MVCRSVCMYVCMSVVCQINCVGGITCGPRACSKSFFFAVKPVTPVLLGERSEPHTGVFNRDYAWYVGRYVCMSVVCQITWNHVNQTRACSKSVLGAKILPVTLVLFVSTLR